MSAVNKQSIYFWAITPINVMGNADFSVMQRSGMLVNSLKIYIKFNLNHMLKMNDVLSLLGLVSS